MHQRRVCCNFQEFWTVSLDGLFINWETKYIEAVLFHCGEIALTVKHLFLLKTNNLLALKMSGIWKRIWEQNNSTG